MKKSAGLLGLVIALAIGYFIFKAEFTQGPMKGAPPKQVIDVVSIKDQMVTMGQAERMYLASHGSYATLDQLQQEGSLTFKGSDFRGYHLSVDVDDGQHFTITATPADAATAGGPTLTMDDTLNVSQQ
jgi:hypothetical protein